MTDFYASFGSGYRRTAMTYDGMGMQIKANRHPIFPDRIDGRGLIIVTASSFGRARYLAAFYLKNEYSGLKADTSMWIDWDKRSGSYETSPSAFQRENNGSLVLGHIDEDGLRWGE